MASLPTRFVSRDLPEDQEAAPPNFFLQILRLVYIYGINSFGLFRIFLGFLKEFVLRFIFQREKSINGEIVLITGSGGYLGRCLALEFAKRNPILVLWDINEDENEKTNEALKQIGYKKAKLYTVDLTDHDQLKATAQKVKEQVGDVSIVVMAAAPTFRPKSILDIDYREDIEKHFKIGYLSQVWMYQEFLKPMISKNHGHFATISSSSALADIPLISSYASFKTAQACLINNVREEIKYNSIKGVHTTLIYLNLLNGGLADGFLDSYNFSKGVAVTGYDAACYIVKGILQNKVTVYIPGYMRFYVVLKALTPKLFSFLVSLQLKINNQKFLRLKNKQE